MNKASNIDDTYRNCDPEQPLTADDERYVDLAESRGTPQIARSITRNISRSNNDTYLQLLFTGHRGSGKTTELFRLKRELENHKFFTIYLDIEETIDLGSLSYLDVLIAIAKQVQISLHEADMPISEVLLDSIATWFAERIIVDDTQTAHEAKISTKAEAGIKIPFFKLFADLTANIKAASSRRETIRINLKREISVFIQKLNTLIGEARQTVQNNNYKDLVIIVDGLEKMHYELNEEGQSSHSELFVRHAEQLRSPACHIIYTVPVSLAYNQNLGADFDDIKVLPMVKTNERGIQQLVNVVEQRVDIGAVFETRELLEELARTSGGVVRDLMRLIRMSTDTDSEKISQKEISDAINTLKKQYDRLIRNDDIENFKQIVQTRRVQADESFSRLLNLRLILEYENGERWASLHPVIHEIDWVSEALSDIHH
ncbi:MAG: Unknown protein [uncultured Thiotrichaceae bacterium]|uniref:Type II secretory pathway, ATPase PulE/Tfp pilus assembly pathway, ATPase PilB n=1 Tax=uncultured Thiotrichaceae bacterium TaxID=298394 RepID=A0A6S6SPA7_9GAMM|nr:MAG: Unknown protein [uncultured Thiotrichaceae bacterium]